MIRLALPVLLVLLLALAVPTAKSQTYVKLNGLYALAGVINPAVEFTIAPKSTFQTELVISPWKNFRLGNTEGPMKFLILMNEYRRYFRQHNDGWYVGANFGMTAFHMTKPLFDHGKLRLKDESGKGYGIMIGVVGGYEWVFNNKWILDAFFGWAWIGSWYNGYALKDGVWDSGREYNKGEVILYPHGRDYPDPFNGSGEWLPNKIGVSFGIKIIDPNKRKSNF